jgi:hypothetical protein
LGPIAGFADGILSALVEVHAGIVELAEGLGVTAAPASPTNAASNFPKEPS